MWHLNWLPTRGAWGSISSPDKRGWQLVLEKPVAVMSNSNCKTFAKGFAPGALVVLERTPRKRMASPEAPPDAFP